MLVEYRCLCVCHVTFALANGLDVHNETGTTLNPRDELTRKSTYTPIL